MILVCYILILPVSFFCLSPQVRLPFSREGLKLAVLNAERYAGRNVQRHVSSGKVVVPDRWKQEIAAEPELQTSGGGIDYDALIRRVEAMDANEFVGLDMDKLVSQYSK